MNMSSTPTVQMPMAVTSDPRIPAGWIVGQFNTGIIGAPVSWFANHPATKIHFPAVSLDAAIERIERVEAQFAEQECRRRMAGTSTGEYTFNTDGWPVVVHIWFREKGDEDGDQTDVGVPDRPQNRPDRGIGDAPSRSDTDHGGDDGGRHSGGRGDARSSDPRRVQPPPDRVDPL